MGHSSSDAAAKDVQIIQFKEECALDMGQRVNDMNALLVDAQKKWSEEECVLSTER